MRRDEKKGSEPEIPWENILTSLEESVIVVDLNGKICFFNQAAEALTDTSSSQALQQPYARLFGRTPWLIDMVKKSQSPQQSGSRTEGDFVKSWGRQVPVSLTISPLHDQHGRSLGSILLLRDLTRRRELEEDLKRSDRLAMLGNNFLELLAVTRSRTRWAESKVLLNCSAALWPATHLSPSTPIS